MKGIILAGGTGSRLFPATIAVSKQLIPVYDKPMIYYPLSVLLLAGIKEILIITTPEDSNQFKRLLGDGSKLGVSFTYALQEKPEGLAQAFLIGEKFIGQDSVTLILGDNIFFGEGFSPRLEETVKLKEGAVIWGYRVKDPERYGVAEIEKNYRVISIEEKPKVPKSDVAITGLYMFDNKVVEHAKTVKPSARGELEITSVIDKYLQEKKLTLEMLGRGFSWLDTGTHESLQEASSLISTIEHRQGLKVGCLEEICFSRGYINKNQLMNLAEPMLKNEYGKYLVKIAEKSN